MKINKILSAPNLLGHILLAVLLPGEGWGEMDFTGRSLHAEDSGYCLCKADSIRGENHLSPLQFFAPER